MKEWFTVTWSSESSMNKWLYRRQSPVFKGSVFRVTDISILLLFYFRLRQESKVPTSCQNKDNQRRISITLIAIVAMFFVLICPSEIVHFYSEVAEADVLAFDLALSITNVLQTLNFALNFVLYCAVNRHFRRTLTKLVFQHLLCGMCRTKLDVERVNSIKSTRVSLLSRPNAAVDQGPWQEKWLLKTIDSVEVT